MLCYNFDRHLWEKSEFADARILLHLSRRDHTLLEGTTWEKKLEKVFQALAEVN